MYNNVMYNLPELFNRLFPNFLKYARSECQLIFRFIRQNLYFVLAKETLTQV
jgi:hypothetical protein